MVRLVHGDPLFRMDQAGKDYREEVIEGATDPTSLPKDLRGSLQALRAKTVDGVLLTPSIYTGIVTNEGGKIIPISREEWSWH